MPVLLQRIFLLSGIGMIVDLAFFGPGLVIPGVGISLRRLLFALIIVVLTFRRLLAKRPFTRHELAFIAALLAFGVIWGFLIPGAYGFPIGFSVADISPWMGLVVLAIWPWDAWPRLKQWKSFCRFLVAIALLLALVHILIWTLLTAGIVSREAFQITAKLVSSSDDASGFLVLVPLDNGQYRVFWSSSIFLLGGFYFVYVGRGRKIIAWLLQMALAATALFTTYIRAFLGALVIFALAGAMVGWWRRGREHTWPEFSVLSYWTMSVTFVSVAINPSFLEALGLARSESDVERVEQSAALLVRFAAHPLLGSGFGSYVTQLVRGVEAPFSYELVFYALLMKLGVFGLLFLVVVLALGLKVAHASAFAHRDADGFNLWLAFTTGLWFAGATNPMITNFVGMTIVLLLLVDMRVRAQQGLAVA